MSKILVVGNVTRDIIHSVDHYPAEDEELRAQTQTQRNGGNAANTALILVQHDHLVSFAGTFAGDMPGQSLYDALKTAGIDLRYAQVIPDGTCPISCITHNLQTGSRTIVHYRDLPEYPAGAFVAIPLSEYDWFHFEGRNLEQLQLMLDQLWKLRIDQPISIEIEKPRPGIEAVFPKADVLLFSHAYAMARGCEHAEQLFRQVQAQSNGAMLVCSWGAQGAFVCQEGAEVVHVPAQPVNQIVDSVGAGDTFNAGVIHALLRGQTLAAAVAYANALAAKKLVQDGFENLVG